MGMNLNLLTKFQELLNPSHIYREMIRAQSKHCDRVRDRSKLSYECGDNDADSGFYGECAALWSAANWGAFRHHLWNTQILNLRIRNQLNQSAVWAIVLTMQQYQKKKNPLASKQTKKKLLAW